MFCDNNVVITNWKHDKKIQVFKVLIFWKRTVTVNFKNFLQAPSLDDMLLVIFTLSNSIISLKYLIKWKRGFEIFLIDHYAGDIGNKKISLVSIKKSFYHCDPPYTRWVSSHRVLYLKFVSTYNICIIYLHVIEACLKVTVAVLYFFFHSKNPSDVIKNIFNSISIYLLTNRRNKGT